jgi:hypothetical protein
MLAMECREFYNFFFKVRSKRLISAGCPKLIAGLFFYHNIKFRQTGGKSLIKVKSILRKDLAHTKKPLQNRQTLK